MIKSPTKIASLSPK